MEIQETREGAVTVVKPTGSLVQADADKFKAYVHAVVGRSLGRFVIDASAISYVDSKGLEVLADCGEEMTKNGQTLRLCGANDTVREAIDITDLASLFEYFADTHTAVRSFL